MFGFHCRMLMIDITKKSVEVHPISEEVLCRTLGGKGLATHLSFSTIRPAQTLLDLKITWSLPQDR